MFFADYSTSNSYVKCPALEWNLKWKNRERVCVCVWRGVGGRGGVREKESETNHF